MDHGVGRGFSFSQGSQSVRCIITMTTVPMRSPVALLMGEASKKLRTVRDPPLRGMCHRRWEVGPDIQPKL
jgi:hypothetical protein